ncbi:hypothetical protein [Actinobacillus equuli]|uniref:hypothetical protein n=1 Tax=Actinobacillus equuli TaxID=718 RepID=UPI002443512D|nr:hypothetical protein [Actinobacillus equuli]WGE52398.1 hypothetical protein NYR69_08085 [Actinobacillus equuli subsp. haemolyticus]
MSEIKALYLDAVTASNISESKKQKWKDGFSFASEENLKEALLGMLKLNIEQASKLEDQMLSVSKQLRELITKH